MRLMAVMGRSMGCLAVLGGVMLPLQPAVAADTKVGFVSTERVLRESSPAKAAQKKLEQEFAKREKELQEASAKLRGMVEKLERDAPVMSEADRGKRQREISDTERDLQRRQREFREDLNLRQNEENAAVIEKANKAIKQIAEAEKYDLILQDVVWVSPRLDITERVIKALADGK